MPHPTARINSLPCPALGLQRLKIMAKYIMEINALYGFST
jgi:hypothetical protein